MIEVPSSLQSVINSEAHEVLKNQIKGAIEVLNDCGGYAAVVGILEELTNDDS